MIRAMRKKIERGEMTTCEYGTDWFELRPGCQTEQVKMSKNLGEGEQESCLCLGYVVCHCC